MAAISITVNNQLRTVEARPDTPLLWVLRDVLQLRGTKYGCGVGLCGICTVLIDGQPNHACMVPVGRAAGTSVLTIEGLAQAQPALAQAWVAEQVPQCGYCQGGQMLAAAALLARHPLPSNGDIDEALSGVLCRCGTYPRIRRAIHRAAAQNTAANAIPPALTSAPDAGVPLNDFIRVHADNSVTLMVNHSEMGQGALTGLAVLVAEELELPLSCVRTQFAPADTRYKNPLWGEQFTGGSSSVRGEWLPLRRHAAAAREQLIDAAAKRWRVKRERCRAENGAVLHAGSDRRLEYAELAATAAEMKPRVRLRLKQPGEFSLVGTPVARLDIPDMVAGRTRYGIDVTRPGMRVASVVRCPVPGGRARRVDAAAARAVAGVHDVVQIEGRVAVVAGNFPAALKGRDVLSVDWDVGDDRLFDNASVDAALDDALMRTGKVQRDSGNTRRALEGASRVIEASYYTPYLAHATLEPMNCVAELSASGCDLWVGTQSQVDTQAVAARLTGLPKRKVRVHTEYLGGGFGRRLETDFVADAIELAMRVGAPVQVIWTRADDLQHDLYRPAGAMRLQAALGESGDPDAWFMRIAGSNLVLQGVDVPYVIPHVREERVEIESPLPTGAWRSVGASNNAFAIESFIDELADAAGRDPFDYRRALLKKSPRHRAVLELVAAKSSWDTPLPPGRGRGIAVYGSFGSIVAQVAEVSVKSDRIRVERVVCAIDCGIAVNPDSVRAQVEGSVAMGVSAALKEEIRIEAGRVTQANFADYPILTLSEMPVVEVHILNSGEEPGGVGEPAVPPTAAAVANAVFAATGRRLRRLPLRLA